MLKKTIKLLLIHLIGKVKAKKSGFEMNDIITELKIENFDRPNKDIVYIFSFIALLIFGFLNYKKYRFSDKLH